MSLLLCAQKINFPLLDYYSREQFPESKQCKHTWRELIYKTEGFSPVVPFSSGAKMCMESLRHPHPVFCCLGLFTRREWKEKK